MLGSESASRSIMPRWTPLLVGSERRRKLVRARVLLADDHSSLLEAVSALLGPYFDIVGTARDGAALVEEALRLNPDVIVADITMPVLSGIEAANKLRDCGCPARVVFLTIHAEGEFVRACMAGGALGYVLKGRMKAHLVPAVQAALAGRTYITPVLSL